MSKNGGFSFKVINAGAPLEFLIDAFETFLKEGYYREKEIT